MCLAVMSNVATHICVYVFEWRVFSVLLGGELPGPMVVLCLTF